MKIHKYEQIADRLIAGDLNGNLFLAEFDVKNSIFFRSRKGTNFTRVSYNKKSAQLHLSSIEAR